MLINRDITFKNSNLCSITYGAVLDAVKATNSNPFTMSIRCQDEWAVIAKCVNVGIDSYLEAIIDAQEEFDNGECRVTPSNLCVLLRRLSEISFDTDEEWDTATSLQDSILTVLGFDDTGKYVGREALGLE